MAAPTAHYPLTDDVLVEGFMRASKARGDAMRKRYLVYAAVMLGMWGVFRFWGGSRDPLLPIMALAFVLAAASRPFLVRRNLERMVRGRTDLGREVTAWVSGDALRFSVAGVSEESFVLRMLHAVEPEPEGILVLPQPSTAVWIPAGGFDSDADRDAFEHALLAGAPLPDPAL